MLSILTVLNVLFLLLLVSNYYRRRKRKPQPSDSKLLLRHDPKKRIGTVKEVREDDNGITALVYLDPNEVVWEWTIASPKKSTTFSMTREQYNRNSESLDRYLRGAK